MANYKFNIQKAIAICCANMLENIKKTPIYNTHKSQNT